MERIGCRMQFRNIFVVLHINRGGGLALLWSEEISLDIQTYSDNYIDACINHGVDDAWQFTGFYEDPDTASREDSWSLLKALSQRSNYPWVVLGDFNEILLAEEKQGGLDRPEWQMLNFREALDFFSLKDLGFNGFPFTWCNRRPGVHNTWVRLDRGVATVDWILRFPTIKVHHLDCFHSDHKPVFLGLDLEVNRYYRKGRPFRFEAMWLKDNSCEKVIQMSWKNARWSGLVDKFNQNIVSCQEGLKGWNRNTFGHVRKTLQRSLKDLKQVKESDGYRNNPGHIFEL